MRYNLPLTDQRYLDTTEDAIIFDLLVTAYYEHERAKATDPDAQTEEEMQRGNLRAAYQAMEDEFTSGKMQETLQKRARRKRAKPDAKQILTLTTGVFFVGR